MIRGLRFLINHANHVGIVNKSSRKLCTSLIVTNKLNFQSQRSILVPVEQSEVRSFPYLPSAQAIKQSFKNLKISKRFPHPQAYTDITYESFVDELKRFPRLASPVIQIFSVDIHRDLDDEIHEKPCEIYGSIQVHEEGQGCSSSLFYKHPTDDDPEIIWKHGNLSRNNSASLIPCYVNAATKMDICLRDRTRDGRFIIEGQHFLHSNTEDFEESCDKLIKALVRGHHGYACVYYTMFQFAVLAGVTLEISLKDNASCSFTDIYGSIIARYPNADQFCSSEDDMKYMKSTLFNKTFDHSVPASVSSPIRLSEFYVAVPAYSPSLIIDADLRKSDHGVFVYGCVEFPVSAKGDFKEVIGGEDGFISVNVSWNTTFEMASIKKFEINREEGAQNLIVCDQQESNSGFHPYGRIYSFEGASSEGSSMVEVFSVSVKGFTHNVSTLCGHIVFSRGMKPRIYERDLWNPEFLSNKNIASIECNVGLDIEQFCIDLWLKDPVQGLEISRGDLGWAPPTLERAALYDKRLSSIVRGEHGYAVVHYMVFREARSALVQITLLSNDNGFVPTNVYGCIFAQYSTHDYESAYEKKYFRSRLFDKPSEESLQLEGTHRSELTLLKSVVAVSIYSSLIVKADLRVIYKGYTDEETLIGMPCFDIDSCGTIEKIIRGLHCIIVVSVKYG